MRLLTRRSLLTLGAGLLTCALALPPATAETAPEAGSESRAESHWLRYPAISPDGTTVVFSWRGDLWTVPSAGGEARLLTHHGDYEAWPVWSPDSKTIAFASDRHGQLDVFTIPAQGGPETRLTFHSSGDRPVFFEAVSDRLWFTSDRQHAPQALLGAGAFGELYSIPLSGGSPRQELTTPAEQARLSADGRWVIYEDHRAYEDEWRKHHTSSASRDLWLWDRESGRHLPLADFRGEDREPRFTANGDVVYLSGRDGTLDIWRVAVAADGSVGEPRQVTEHGPHPVRFLSSADDGTLAYGYHGAIFTLAPGGEPQQVSIDLAAGEQANAVEREVHTGDATEMAVSPLGDELAFVVRGDIFVASVEHGTTRRLTATPEQERSLSWAPDGRAIYFASERNESWNLYKIGLALDDEERFFEATLFDESEVLVSEDETFQPVVSPDGKTLAFLHNRDELRVLDLESGEQKTMIPAERNYSYSDGDRSYTFSPDGRWLAANYIPYRRWIDDVALVEVESGTVHNVTQSGYSEGAARFGAEGNHLYFVSDRFGMRSHGSWGSEMDVFSIALNQETWDLDELSPEAYARLKKKERKERRKGKDGDKKDAPEDKKKKDRKKQGDQGPSADKAPKAERDDEESWGGMGGGDRIEEGDPIRPIDPVETDLEDLDHRLRRMTLFPSRLSDFAVARNGETVFFLASTAKGFDLWMVRPRSKETRRLTSLGPGGGELELSHDGRKLFVLSNEGRISYMDVGFLVETSFGKKRDREGGMGGGGGRLESVAFKAESTVDTLAERHHMFEHVWRQVKRKFYVEDLHGADWPMLKAEYSIFLNDIRHGRDFAELLSELLGELNASHTGGSYRERNPDADSTASLGLLYDPAFEGPGLKVADVYKRGPADRDDSVLVAGSVITHIDGTELTAETNPWALLNHQAGKRTRLTVRQADGSTADEVIEPIPGRAERGLRYERWIQRLRDKTEELSGGRIGYVHVQGMNDASFRRFYQDALGKMSDKEALIIDTRYNGGGWLHDDLAAFLQAEDYLWITPRGKEVGSFGAESQFRWTRPVAVLQNESNYSDAHIFPWAFKELELGVLVGMPVAGTGTAVWWERLIDGKTVFGIPQVGMVDKEGRYVENQDLEPHVKVQNTPESVLAGEDAQLKAAVDTLLNDLPAAP